ncbi:hypothetical protein ACLOJK_012725 [Asimina triloba]
MLVARSASFFVLQVPSDASVPESTNSCSDREISLPVFSFVIHSAAATAESAQQDPFSASSNKDKSTPTTTDVGAASCHPPKSILPAPPQWSIFPAG